MNYRQWIAGAALAVLVLQPSVLSAPPPQITPPVQQLAKTLNHVLEHHLKQTLQRQKVGVEITPVVKGEMIALQPASHLERDTVFQVQLDFRKRPPLLKGKVLTTGEKQLLLASAQSTLKQFRAEIEVHPYSDPTPDYGLIKPALANLYVKPIAQAGENLATQARLGTPVKILEASANQQFYRVLNVDDGYIAWVKASEVQICDAKQFEAWHKGRNVVLVNPVKNGNSMVYLGTRLKLLAQQGGSATLELPTGQKLRTKFKDVLRYEDKSLDSTKILAMSKQYLPQGQQGRVTYLWGGSIGNQLDCSGYVQTVFGTQNILLPRDADQQKGFSQPVAPTLKQIDELQPGDLVFFSGNRKYPTHVGIYIGKNQFIHSSPKGAYSGVKINTLRGGGEYDKMLQGIYFGGGRIVRSLMK